MFININITIRLNTFSRIYIFDKYMSRAGYTISNEDLLLINILNGMYNDNLRQIDRMNTSINTLNADNSRIRNLLIRLLRNQRENNNARGPNNTTRGENNTTRGENNARVPNNVTRGTNNVGASIERTAPVNTTIPTSIFGSSNGSGRLFVNNAPYVIDSFQQYRIPSAGGGAGRTFFSETLRNFYEPVNVYPTQAQIAAATRIVRYSDIGVPRNRSCPISIIDFNDSDMVMIIRNCGHIFHTEELRTWFTTHCTCPVCRFDIREARNNSTSNLETTSASENITSAAENIIRATEDITRATDNIISEVERQEERNTPASTEPPPPEITSSRDASVRYSMTEIFDGLLNSFDIQDVEIMISDLSNNLIAPPNPQTLFSLVSRFNNNTRR
jgi:hypothetical protein